MLSPNSLAAANAVSAKNESFAAEANVLQRKILIIGTYDPLKLDVVDDVPKLVLSPEDVGSQFGFGFMVHRLAQQSFKGSRGVPTYIIPQAEAGGAVAADGKVAFTAVGLKAGTIHLYLSGDRSSKIAVNVVDAETATAVAAKVIAAVNAIKELPATALVDGINDFEMNLTSKTKGPWGNGISIEFNLQEGEELPVGLSVVITDMASGAGVPNIQTALDGTGTGDNQNEKHFTGVSHGYGMDSDTLNKVSSYNGAGDEKVGNYSEMVARPFRSLSGDTTPESAGLTALIAITDLRLLDRTNGVIPVPGSPNHPDEIAALAMGIIERINNTRAEQTYINEVLEDIFAGADDERWTNDYDNRDIAVKSGISPTLLKSGVMTLQNVVSYYRPENVPVNTNSYRSMRNISIVQNILDATKTNFARDKWQGITIVEDVTEVADVSSRLKARDINSIIDDLVELARLFKNKAWIFTDSFTVDELKKPGAVTIRDGANGFDNRTKYILSGEGGILNTENVFDASLAVLLQ